MKKFYLFKAHDYMDMYPHDDIQCFESEEQAHAYAKHMNEHYSGGTTSFDHEMTKEEAADYLCKQLKECLMDTCWPDELNIEEALKVAGKNNITAFFECYGRDHILEAQRSKIRRP